MRCGVLQQLLLVNASTVSWGCWTSSAYVGTPNSRFHASGIHRDSTFLQRRLSCQHRFCLIDSNTLTWNTSRSLRLPSFSRPRSVVRAKGIALPLSSQFGTRVCRWMDQQAFFHFLHWFTKGSRGFGCHAPNYPPPPQRSRGKKTCLFLCG